MHKLVIQDDEGKTTVVPLIKEQITVGRKEGNTIRLTERNVSRQHARISRRNGSIEIEDLDSYNGVRVNGSRIQGRMGLKLSDRIQIGDYLIELKAEGSAPELDAYGDQKTVPIDRGGPAIAAAAASGTAIPIMQNAADPDAQTTKMPMSSPGLTMGNQPAEPHGDTDPATAAMGGVAEPMQQEVYGRLVILSANFAGREYELNKPGLVIGRTEDNDVVINHRSISRHHAKVVRENGRYAIVDLQSSNGVRVNGEEYGKVELRRGDIIDLGHVRLRFIEPGEDFIFGRDAQAVPLPSEKRRGLIYAVLGLAVIAVVAVLAFGGGGDGKKADEPTDQAVVPDGPDVTKMVEPPPSTTKDDDEIRPLLDRAEEAVKARNWDKAINAANQVLEINSKNETATHWRQTAEREKPNQTRFEKLQQAVKDRDYPTVVDTREQIDKDSVYNNEAWDLHNDAKSAYIKALTERARKENCPELPKLKADAGSLWPDAVSALQQMEKRCSAVAAVESPRNAPDRTSVKKPKEDDDPPPKEPPKQVDPKTEYERHMRLSKDAMMATQFGAVLNHCKKAISHKPGDREAIKICAIAGCRLKNPKVAKRYIDKLKGRLKESLVNICVRIGLPQANAW